MYEILMPVDRDADRALAQARTVAAMPGTDEFHVRVLHSFTDNPTGASVSQVNAARRARDVLTDAGIEVTLDEASGDPSETILAAADEYDVDLVCIAGRKRTPAGKVLFGSVTQAVILDSDRPVLVCSVDDEE